MLMYPTYARCRACYTRASTPSVVSTDGDMGRLRRGRFSIRAVLLFIASMGCHPRTHPAPVPFERTYCWWTTEYATVSPTWIAARFQSALQTIGFPNVRAGRGTDTAWASA